jgi:hypothetical protein
MSNPLIHDCYALNPLADNIRSIRQRRISDGGIQNQTEIMSCLLETEIMEKKDVLFFSFLVSSQKGGDQRYVPVQHSCFHFALATWSIMTTTTQQQR